jgi:hypothetical protein
MLYSIILWLHSYLRWAIVLMALVMIAVTFAALRSGRAWSKSDEARHKALLGMVDLQFLLGVLLFVWLSPISRAFFAAPKAGMHDPALRFFGMEHAVGMLIALAVLHIGRKRSQAAASDLLRHRRACLSTLLFLVLAAVSIPWPGSAHGRPLFRGPRGASDANDAGMAHVQCPPTYAARCASCHGERGHGDGIAGQYLKPKARDFADPEFQEKRSDAQILAVIREGGAAHGLSAAMPAHSDLSESELGLLVTCVRGLGQQK